MSVIVDETILGAITRAVAVDPEGVLLEVTDAFGLCSNDEQAALINALGRSVHEGCSRDEYMQAYQLSEAAKCLDAHGRQLVVDLAEALGMRVVEAVDAAGSAVTP